MSNEAVVIVLLSVHQWVDLWEAYLALLRQS